MVTRLTGCGAAPASTRGDALLGAGLTIGAALVVAAIMLIGGNEVSETIGLVMFPGVLAVGSLSMRFVGLDNFRHLLDSHTFWDSMGNTLVFAAVSQVIVVVLAKVLAMALIKEFRGKWLALYFYPRDDTPGCTAQACRFRDETRAFDELGAVVCGVSVDSSESHANFAREQQLAFPLLSDKGGVTAARYGSLWNLGLLKFAKRNTDRKSTRLNSSHSSVSRMPSSA